MLNAFPLSRTPCHTLFKCLDSFNVIHCTSDCCLLKFPHYTCNLHFSCMYFRIQIVSNIFCFGPSIYQFRVYLWFDTQLFYSILSFIYIIIRTGSIQFFRWKRTSYKKSLLINEMSLLFSNVYWTLIWNLTAYNVLNVIILCRSP